MLIFRKPLRFFQAVPAVCLGLACLLAVSASAQAQQARTLTFTFSDDGSTVSIDAAGSLDFSASGSLPDSTIGIEDAIYFDDTDIWAIGADSSGLNSLMGQYQLSGLTTTVVEPFSGSPTAENLPNYSAEFFLRFSTFHNRMRVDPDNLTGTIYDPTGDRVTFTGTLQSTLGDNDFHIEHAFGNQKIVFKTAAPATVPPAAPTGLSAAPGDTEATLTWANPNDSSITKYQVRYGAGSTVPATATWGDISGSDDETTTHTVTGLTNTTQYAFEIRAVNVTGNSDASATVTTTPALAIPDAPTSLTATAGNAQVTLTWTNPTNASTLTNIQVRYKATADLPFNDNTDTWTDLAATTTTYTATGLTNGTGYTFAVRATNTAGNSTPATATATPTLPAPSAPTGLSAAAGDTQVTLNWTDPNDDTITKYQVRYGAGSTVPATATWGDITGSGATTISHDVTGLTNGTQYAFEIRAVNATGNSDASATVTTTPTAPTPVRTLTFTFSDDGATTTIAASGSLDMSGFTDVGDTVPQHVIYIKIDDTDELWAFHPASLSNGAPSRRYEDLPDFIKTGLSSYTGYTEILNLANYSNDFTILFNTYRKYMVVDKASLNGDIYNPTGKTVTYSGTVLDTLGDNDFHIELALGNQKIVYTATPPPAPAAPTNLSATAGDTEVTLNWANPNDSSITKYQFRQAQGATVPDSTAWTDITGSGATTTSHKVTGLTNTTQYAFQIRAVNANGDSDASGTVTATPALAVPAAPTEFSATAGNAQASLSWTLPTNASVIGDVQVRWKATADLPFNDATDTWTGLSDGTATSYIATGLTNGTGYTFEVRATNTAGNGAAATATATPAMPPAAPTGLAATAGDSTVTLNWTNPNDSNITTYQLRYGAGATVPATATWGDIAGTTSHTVTGLTNGTQYAFEIRAVNAGGPGPASEHVVMRPGPPLQPSGFQVVGGNAQVTLSWDDPPSDTTITRYQLRRKVGTSFSDSDTWSDIANSGPTITTHTVTGLTNGATWAFQIRAVNAAGAGPASETLTMLPRASNRAPVFRGAVFRSDGEVLSSSYRNARLTKGFSPRFSDPDGDELTFTWTTNPPQANIDVRIEGPGWSTVNPESQYLRYRATGPVERTTLTLTGTDPYGLSVSTSTVVTTSNTAPKAKSPPYPDQTLAVGNTLTVNLTDMFIDDEGDNIRLFLRTPDNGNNIDTTALDWGAISVLAHTPGEEVFSVTVKDIFGAEASDSFKVTVIAAAAKPTGLTAASGNGQAVLTWTDPGDSSITKYQLRHKAGTSFSNSDDSLWTDITGSGASTTSHTVTGLTSGTAYVFQVRALNAGGVGTPSDEAVLRLGAPLQPSGFRVLGGNAQVTLSWSDPSDATITRYQLRRKEGTSFSPSDDSLWADIANSGATTTTHTVSGLTNGTTWAFQVRAVNANGAGPASETLTMLPRANNRAPVLGGSVFGSDGVVLPSRYRNVRLTKGFGPRFSDPDGDELTFTWTANPPQANLDVLIAEPGYSDAYPDAHYLRYRATGAVERTTLTLTGTDPYGLSVSTSAVVTTSNTAPKAKSPPYPDQTLAVGNTLRVNLTDMFVDDEGDRIRLYLRTPDNGNNVNTRAIDWGAFRVIAHTPGEEAIEVTVDDIFRGEASDIFKVTVIAAAAKPAGFTATSGDTQAELAWTDPGDSGITKYQSRHKAGTSFSDGDDSLWTDIDDSGASTTSHTVTGLTNGTAYVFQIRAVNAGGPGAASDTTTATPVTDLMPDFGTATVADQSYVQNTQITTLNLPQATGGDGTLTYSLSPDAPDGLAFDAANRTLSGTPTTGQAATAYTYTATDADGDTASLTFNITVMALPDKPTGLTSVGTDAKVTLSWTNPGDATITKYQVRHAAAAFVPEETIWTDITGSGAGTTSHDVTGLTNGTRYAFEIRAVNAGGAGAAATIRGTPVMARTLTYTFSDDGATVTIAASGSVDLRGFDFNETSSLVPGGQQSIKIDASDSGASNVWAIQPPNDIWVRTYASLPNFVTTGRGSYEGSSSLSQMMGYSANFHIRFETSGNFLQLDDANLSGYIYEISDGVATFTGTLDGLLDDDFRVEHTIGNQKIVFTSAAPGALPNAPNLTAATAGDTQVELTWTDPGDASITKYQVRHGEGQTVPSSATWADITGSGATTTTHTVMGLTNGKAYAFEIRAVNASGYSDASNTVSATPLAKPSAPAGLAAAAGNAKATLTWTDPGNASITKYQVRYGAGSSVPATANWEDIPGSGATTVRHEVTGLTNGTQYAFEIRAVNASGGSDASDTVTATPASGVPSFGDQTVDDQNYILNTAIATLTLPAATSDEVPLTYSLTPNAPAGLAFDATNRSLTGTPTAVQSETAYTYTATDSDGDAVSLTFNITIAANEMPDFGTATVADQSYTQNTAITTLNLPAATGGDGTLTYTLTPDAPAGLTFDAANRRLTGTPTGTQAATAYTYTATDADGDTASLTFNITITALPVPSAPTDLAAAAGNAQATLTWTDPGNDSITKYQVRYGEGATVPSTATWADIPGSGATTVRHEVTGLTNGTEHAFEVRAVNASGEGAAAGPVTATPAADTTPSFGTATVADQSYTQNTVVTTLNLPAATGGDAPLTYTLTPTPPAGLTFDASARTLTGTPTTAQTAAEYTYKVTDNDGDAAELKFNIRVAANLTLTGLADATVNENVAHTDAATLTNAIGAVTWSLGGTDGGLFRLTATSAAGATVNLAGQDYENPADDGANNTYVYTLTATDSDGNSVTSDPYTVTVSDVNETANLTLTGLADATVNENVAHTDAATLTNAIGAVTWSLGGTDGGLFRLTATSAAGATVNLAGQDYENPADDGANNTYVYTLTATDSDGNSVTSDPYTVTVSDVNETANLTLTGLADATVNENVAHTDAATLANAIGAVTWSLGGTDGGLFRLTATSATGATVNLAGQDYENPADDGANNTYVYTLTATDSDGNSVTSDPYTVTVDDVDETTPPPPPPPPPPPNNAPVLLMSAGDQILLVDENRTLDIMGLFNDSDGDVLIYTATTDASSIVAVNVDSAERLTLTGVALGETNVTITVSDGRGGTASDTFKVTVAPPNEAPVVATPLSDLTLVVDQTQQVDVSGAFSDADGDALTYTAVSADETVVTVTVTGSALTLTGVSVGAATITVTADDGRGTASDLFTVTVALSNEAPEVATPLSDQTLDVDQTQQVDISATFTDADGDALTYTAVSADTSVVTVAITGATLTLTGTSAGDTTVTVTADDGRGGTVSDRFAVTVVMPNRAPAVDMPLSDQGIDVDQVQQVDVSNAFTDADGDTLTYTAVSDDETIVTVTLSGSDLTLTGVSVGVANVTVTAADETGEAVSDTFAVTVSEAPIDAVQVTDVHEDLLPHLTLSVIGRTTQALSDRISSVRSGAGQTSTILGRSVKPSPSTEPGQPTAYGAESGLPLLDMEALPEEEEALPDLGAGAETLIGIESGSLLSGTTSRVGPSAGETGQPLSGNEERPALSGITQTFGHSTQALPGTESRVDPTLGGSRTGGRTQRAPDVFDVFDTPGGWEYRRRFDLRQLLNRASFVLPLNFGADDGSESGEPGKVVTLWGEGSYTDLRSKGNNAVTWDGGVANFHLGADIEATEQLLLGAALSRTEGRFDYTDRSDARRAFTGDYDISLTSLYPYADWMVSPDLSIWGALGYGLGELDLTVDDEGYRQESDVDMYSAALGVTGRFFRRGGWQLGYQGEAMYAAMSVEDAPDIDVQRVRAVLEGRHMAAMEAGQFEQFAELGVRIDGGDAQSGAGLDLAGGVRYATDTGWALQLRGAGLLANSNYREWQVSGLLEKAYQADGTGWMLRLTPHYSPVRSLGSIEGGARQLWERNIDDMVRGQRSPTSDEYRFGMETEVGYGLFIRDRLWTVYSRTTGLGERSRRFMLGTEMSDVLLGGSVLRVGFEGVREESWNISPEHSFWLNLQWGYR